MPVGVMSKTPEEEHDDIMNMTSQEVQEELRRRGIDTSKSVSHVLQMVREAKKKRDKYRAEMN
jgi:hypothetical protein